MKLFFYSHTLQPGGAEKQCVLIAAELKRRYGYDPTVLLNSATDAKPEFLQHLKAAKIELVELPKGTIARVVRLYQIFRANQDAVLFNYLTYPDFVGALIARLSGLKRIFGGIETDRMFGYKFWLEKFSHKFLSYKTTCNSYGAFEFFALRGFDGNRMPITPSAIEMTPDGDLPNRSSGNVVKIITVGRFVPAKDYLTWLKVVDCLVRTGLNIQATIIGYGELEGMIREQIGRDHLESVVRILPGQTVSVKEELKNHDIYLSTSVREGTSNTILEAMDMALPIVATKVGDNARMVEEGTSGFLRDPKDVAGLVDALQKLVEDCTLRKRFGARAREILREKHSREKIASEYDMLIKDAVSAVGYKV